MHAAAQPPGRGRGPELLIEHCAALARLETAVPTAHERLEALVGRDFARLLLDVLLDGRAPRRR